MTIERPGDVFRPADMAEAKRRADIADELGSRPAGQRWRPTSGRTVLVDNRRRDPEAPVLLKTSIFGSEIVTEWQVHHLGPNTYVVFEVGRMAETERHFAIEETAAALTYHAKLEAAARRREHERRRREIRRERENGATLGELIRDCGAEAVVDAIGVMPIARALGIAGGE